jgi:hypothetical protein
MAKSVSRPSEPQLPPSEPIKGLQAKNPYDLLSPAQVQELKRVLGEDARARRRAAARSATLRFG